MREGIPVPGSARARLIEAALYLFERDGLGGVNVAEIAAKAGVTTGALYHHFGSKFGLYAVVRGDLEKRITDRMEGAAATAGGGRPAIQAALLVAFDAAVWFDACRLLGEPSSDDRPDPVEEVMRSLLSPRRDAAAPVLAAAWRAALLGVADGRPAGATRSGLAFVLAGVDESSERRFV